MSAGGWIFMALSWGVIIGFNLYCFARLTAENGNKR